MHYLGLIGRYTLQAINRASEILALLTLLISARVYVAHGSRRRIFYKLYRRQIYNTGVQSLGATAVVAALLGFLLVFELPAVSAGEQMLPTFTRLYIVVIVRELAPIMCALILIARAGTAITAKIGYLKVFREFETLKAMGINPVHLFLVPVFFAFPLSMLLLVVYFNFFSLAAAYLTLWVRVPGLGPGLLLNNILSQIAVNDLIVILVKALISGFVIGLYSIYFGARMQGRMRDVTAAMSSATSRQFVLVFFFNVAVSVLAYS